MKSHDHLLAEAIFLTLLKANQNLLFDRLVLVLVGLHGRPDELLLRSLRKEFQEVRELEVVMRQMSVSVCILKLMLKPFERLVQELLEKLMRVGEKLGQRKVDILFESPLSADSIEIAKRIKSRLRKGLQQILTAEAIPEPLCIFCFRCADLVKDTPIKKDPDTKIANWTVGALLFLRFIVPMITTSSVLGMQGSNQGKQKGLTFLGRLCMKLCCHSTFPQGDCLANEILREHFSIFDQFCIDVIERGRALWFSEQRLVGEKLSLRLGVIEEGGLDEFSLFLSTHEKEIANRLAEESEDFLVFMEAFLALDALKRDLENGPASGSDIVIMRSTDERVFTSKAWKNLLLKFVVDSDPHSPLSPSTLSSSTLNGSSIHSPFQQISSLDSSLSSENLLSSPSSTPSSSPAHISPPFSVSTKNSSTGHDLRFSSAPSLFIPPNSPVPSAFSSSLPTSSSPVSFSPPCSSPSFSDPGRSSPPPVVTPLPRACFVPFGVLIGQIDDFDHFFEVFFQFSTSIDCLFHSTSGNLISFFFNVFLLCFFLRYNNLIPLQPF